MDIIRSSLKTTPSLTSDARTHAICMLCRLSIDRQVVNSSDIVGVMAVAFANLLESIPEHGFEDQVLRDSSRLSESC